MCSASTCRIRTPASSRPIRRRRRKLFLMGTSRHLPFSAACRCRFCTIISKSRWRAFWATASASEPAFTELVSHYLFQERFGRPGKGNDKGKVEALVKYSRANFLTPVPHAPSFETVNAALEERCCARQAERAGRHEQTIGERLIANQAVLRALPELPFEPCDKRPAKVSSTALVRYRMNDYSAPTAYGFRDVLVKGFVDEVAIICGASEIARHPRVYGRGQFVFDPKHYLALLEQKAGALDQAAPLQNWTLPEPLQHLRRLLEARMGNRGKREFIQALRLIEVFPETLVAAAALDAIRLGAISFDAVKQLVIAKVEHRPANLDLGRYPYLPAANVKTTSAVAEDSQHLLPRACGHRCSAE